MRYIRFRLHVYGQGKVLVSQVLFTVALFYAASYIHIVSFKRKSFLCVELKSMFEIAFLKHETIL